MPERGLRPRSAARSSSSPTPLGVEADERALRIDAHFEIDRQKVARVIAADTKRRLCQIVGAKGEKLADLACS